MKHARRFLIVGAMLAVFALGGVALAAWVADGSGSGQATSTSHVNSTISPASAGAALYPGATKSFTVTINNPNDYPSLVTSISSGSSAAIGGCDAASVTSDALTFDNTGLTQTGGGKLIAAGGTGTYTLVSHMIADPVQSCEGKTFTLSLTATLRSAA